VGGVVTAYSYAGDDRRVSSTQAGVTTTYEWDREARLPTILSDGATTYTYGPAGLATEGSAAGTTYPIRDGLGSVRARTNGAGTVAGGADYDAWGNLRATWGATGRHGWAGEPRDPATGMVHLRARDYSPGSARFTTRDSLQPNGPGTQGWNPYSYAGNSPTSKIDPTGHMWEYVTNGELTYSATLQFNGWALLIGTALAYNVAIVPVLVSVPLSITSPQVMTFMLLAMFFTAVMIVMMHLIWWVFSGPGAALIASRQPFSIEFEYKVDWRTFSRPGLTIIAKAAVLTCVLLFATVGTCLPDRCDVAFGLVKFNAANLERFWIHINPKHGSEQMERNRGFDSTFSTHSGILLGHLMAALINPVRRVGPNPKWSAINPAPCQAFIMAPLGVDKNGHWVPGTKIIFDLLGNVVTAFPDSKWESSS
jgi:RHS repeat-associated protein